MLKSDTEITLTSYEKKFAVAMAALRKKEDGEIVTGVEVVPLKAVNLREARSRGVDIALGRFPKAKGWVTHIRKVVMITDETITHVGAYVTVNQNDANLPVLALGLSQITGTFDTKRANRAYDDTYEIAKLEYPMQEGWSNHKVATVWLADGEWM